MSVVKSDEERADRVLENLSKLVNICRSYTQGPVGYLVMQAINTEAAELDRDFTWFQKKADELGWTAKGRMMQQIAQQGHPPANESVESLLGKLNELATKLVITLSASSSVRNAPVNSYSHAKMSLLQSGARTIEFAINVLMTTVHGMRT